LTSHQRDFPPQAQDLVHGLLYQAVRVVISDVQDFGIRDGSKAGRFRIIEGHRMNEKWDRRFLEMAALVACWSKDPSTKTGAVIVRPDKSVAAVGFNGFPAGMDDSEELYADRETKYSRTVHCEINAMIHACGPVRGYTLYTVPFASCDRCAVQMIQAGISRFVFPELADDKIERWGAALERTVSYFMEMGIPYSSYGCLKRNSIAQ
jgi:dCMP deaminase